MARRKLKMTKKAIASRRRYRAKKAATVGRPTRRRKAKGGNFLGKAGRKVPMKKRPKGKGFSNKFKGINKGTRWEGQYGKGLKRKPKGAGFWEDVGGFFEDVGRTALQILPMIL